MDSGDSYSSHDAAIFLQRSRRRVEITRLAVVVDALPGEIDNADPQRIRALFVSAGNPVHSMPKGDALARAFDKLSLLVSIDIYRNETSAYADYLLPATDMLERSDYPASPPI